MTATKPTVSRGRGRTRSSLARSTQSRKGKSSPIVTTSGRQVRKISTDDFVNFSSSDDSLSDNSSSAAETPKKRATPSSIKSKLLQLEKQGVKMTAGGKKKQPSTVKQSSRPNVSAKLEKGEVRKRKGEWRNRPSEDEEDDDDDDFGSSSKSRTKSKSAVRGTIRMCQCGKAFSRVMLLKAHQKRECGKTPEFQCNKCSFRSYWGKEFRAHIQTKHRIGDLKPSLPNMRTILVASPSDQETTTSPQKLNESEAEPIEIIEVMETSSGLETVQTTEEGGMVTEFVIQEDLISEEVSLAEEEPASQGEAPSQGEVIYVEEALAKGEGLYKGEDQSQQNKPSQEDLLQALTEEATSSMPMLSSDSHS